MCKTTVETKEGVRLGVDRTDGCTIFKIYFGKPYKVLLFLRVELMEKAPLRDEALQEGRR